MKTKALDLPDHAALTVDMASQYLAVENVTASIQVVHCSVADLAVLRRELLGVTG
jgi:hypothetical protein